MALRTIVDPVTGLTAEIRTWWEWDPVSRDNIMRSEISPKDFGSCDVILYDPATVKQALAEAIQAEASTREPAWARPGPDVIADWTAKAYDRMYRGCQTADAEGRDYQSVSTEVSTEGRTSVTLTDTDGWRQEFGFDNENNPTWTFEKDADGSGKFTDQNGTEYDFTADVDVEFDNSDGTPELTIKHGEDGPEVHIDVNEDGSTSVDVNDGAKVTPPADSDVSFDDDGATTETGGGPGPGPGEPGPGPGGPGPGEPGPGPGEPGPGPGEPGPGEPGPGGPFRPGHPSPLERRDPLVLSLDGTPITLTDVHASNAHFDYGGAGFAVGTGWVTSNEGILIRDIDHDSSVTADELFGATSGNGFTDLAALDNNADGKIDSNDFVFADLKVWVDADTDGVADAGELITLADAGIAAINLGTQEFGEIINGNLVVETGTFVRTDQTTVIAEVNFATDTVDSQYTPPEGFEFSRTAFLLPNLIGYGVVPDLIFAMSSDSDLEDAVRDFVLDAGSMNGQQLHDGFEALVQRWTGSDGIDPASRGPLIDARHLAVVEAFYGATYEEMNGEGATLNPRTAANIELAYQAIVDELMIRFVAQASVWSCSTAQAGRLSPAVRCCRSPPSDSIPPTIRSTSISTH